MPQTVVEPLRWTADIDILEPADGGEAVLAEPDHAVRLALRAAIEPSATADSAPAELVVLGPRTKASHHRTGRWTRCAVARLRPGLARTVLGRPARELVDRVVPLSALRGASAFALTDAWSALLAEPTSPESADEVHRRLAAALRDHLTGDAAGIGHRAAAAAPRRTAEGRRDGSRWEERGESGSGAGQGPARRPGIGPPGGSIPPRGDDANHRLGDHTSHRLGDHTSHRLGDPLDLPPHLDLVHAATRLLAAGPDPSATRVRAAALRLHLSERQLRTVFTDGVGLSPKHFARIDRVRSVLARLRERQLARLAMETGYYDHSHLTAEFRRLMGVTPSALLAGDRPALRICPLTRHL
ncbi:AraC-like DNA-binding protein [Actinoalloteichus hoggarensis]|uniref:helix-turn-helix domain-containing protein n=1 Tax=Actinoalloteichus hoggarensis TaxID=1470176 RepID=UPI001823D537|nr:helix-turn-helix domain-containing protein [Actinoalloteichus hoggarensis]MBB5920012.1 AraC-like DNA-binding protein [Actinoalloteichus hoggarensis]